MYKNNLTKQKPFLLQLTRLVRLLTGAIIFRKSLPTDFGRTSMYVTSSSNIRYLIPGFLFAANDLLTVARKYVQPGQIIWDIGSNLGIFSFCAAFKTGKDGHVFSLEANPKYAELQNRSVQRLAPGCAPVTVLCAAMANAISLAELNVSRRGEAKNFLSSSAIQYPPDEIISKLQVVSLTGDFLLQHWGRPDFVKIDIEGAELMALKGSNTLLREIRPIFYIEVIPANQAEATSLFLEYGYKLYALEQDGTERAVDHCHFNTLAVPSEKIISS